eukprot:m51a1_g9770 hypothetical protein (286) ;mRNA; f:1654702-1655722
MGSRLCCCRGHERRPLTDTPDLDEDLGEYFGHCNRVQRSELRELSGSPGVEQPSGPELCSSTAPLPPGLAYRALQPHVLRRVLSYVDPADWPAARRVCRAWRAMCDEDRELWQSWTASWLPFACTSTPTTGEHPRVTFLRTATAVWQSQLPRSPSVSGVFRAWKAQGLAERPSLAAVLRPRGSRALLTFSLSIEDRSEPNGPMGLLVTQCTSIQGIGWPLGVGGEFELVAKEMETSGGFLEPSMRFNAGSGRLNGARPMRMTVSQDEHGHLVANLGVGTTTYVLR